MSLVLDGSKPKPVSVKTYGVSFGGEDATAVHLGEYEIPLEAFLAAAAYVLTNTNLSSRFDPRLDFCEAVKAAQIVRGYGNKGHCLEMRWPRKPEPEAPPESKVQERSGFQTEDTVSGDIREGSPN